MPAAARWPLRNEPTYSRFDLPAVQGESTLGPVVIDRHIAVVQMARERGLSFEAESVGTGVSSACSTRRIAISCVSGETCISRPSSSRSRTEPRPAARPRAHAAGTCSGCERSHSLQCARGRSVQPFGQDPIVPPARPPQNGDVTFNAHALPWRSRRQALQLLCAEQRAPAPQRRGGPLRIPWRAAHQTDDLDADEGSHSLSQPTLAGRRISGRQRGRAYGLCLNS